ncbi:MAG: hypothetical protein K5905_26495 [Roseibium sp.]|uniref:hypothetical protein n=1 Tax=Roseibium sp. TaxID=1936156 RepID=UPI002601D9F8|nr:hypothetical protein [Roseibium sp.]MCV0429020.1 hypothetical protein [Roseibium sp.]
MNQIVTQASLIDASDFNGTVSFKRPIEITHDCVMNIGLTRNFDTGSWERNGKPILEVSTETFLDLIRISTEMGVHHFWQDHRQELFSDRDPASLNASDVAALFEVVRYDICRVRVVDKFHGGRF